MADFTGWRVLVAGASRGIGRAIAEGFARAGAAIAISARGEAGLDAAATALRQHGGLVDARVCDLADGTAIARWVGEAAAALGGIDVLVSSAANFERIPFEEVDEAAIERALTLNVRASFSLAHAAAQTLRERGGNIVLITCTSATLPYANFLPYVVSKGAAKQLMRALAIELAPSVRVNAVAPGTVLPPEEMSVEQREKLAHKTLLRRIGSAEDVAEAVVFLANAGFVTGQEILVDGGVVLAGRDSGEG